MSQDCNCSAEEIILLPCSGGSNCGQIANQVAVSLNNLGVGTLYCLAGIGAHIEGMIESAKGARRLVVIDGCPTACAKQIVEQAGLTMTDWIYITEEGISKKHSLLLDDQEIEPITFRVKELITRSTSN
jgi:uncharacterized metal-binding protein